MAEILLTEIAAQLGGELVAADPGLKISRIGSLDGATPSTLAFLSNPKYLPLLASSAAGCVIVAAPQREAAVARGATIVTADPYLYFARLTQWWGKHTKPQPVAGIHASAVVDPTAQVHESATIGPLAVIEAGAVVAAHAVIGAHTIVGAGATVGEGTRLAPNVSFLAGCHIGARGILHSGVVIGADGFGFAPDAGRWEKIEQLGGVRIGDDVEIGANTCVDRGALDDTVIEEGVKLDNQIQIAHNVHIGAHTAMAACVGVAGSAKIGRHCTIGGAALIMGHITIVDRVNVSAGTFIMRSVHQPGHYTGVFPFDDNATWEKNAASLKQLYKLRERLRALEKKTTP